jgi:hypothetical protein
MHVSAACHCIGGNPCPCQKRRMMESGWSPPTVVPIPRYYVGNPPGSIGYGGIAYVEVASPQVEALRSEEV